MKSCILGVQGSCQPFGEGTEGSGQSDTGRIGRQDLDIAESIAWPPQSLIIIRPDDGIQEAPQIVYAVCDNDADQGDIAVGPERAKRKVGDEDASEGEERKCDGVDGVGLRAIVWRECAHGYESTLIPAGLRGRKLYLICQPK